MKASMSRIEYEKRIVDHMIRIYCRKKHQHSSELCKECDALRSYAFDRLTHCPFKEDKAACRGCLTHCYQKDKRNDIRVVMKFSGPRMILYYPFDFFKHFLK
jgi:uncharacterized paraquat-inducible protein A